MEPSESEGLRTTTMQARCRDVGSTTPIRTTHEILVVVSDDCVSRCAGTRQTIGHLPPQCLPAPPPYHRRGHCPRNLHSGSC